MRALIFLFLLVLTTGHGLAQTPFHAVMAAATVKKVIVVDTVAGKTPVFLASIASDPALVFIFAPGGEGNPGIRVDGGQPAARALRSSAFILGMPFLQKEAAWAVVDMPADFGKELRQADRTTQRYVEAFAQAARRIRDEYPKAKHILIGHSNGGITAGMQAIQPKPPFDGIVMSSPNLGYLPFGWKPEQSTVPIMFIAHRHDECKGTPATRTISAAGDKTALTVIETPTLGDRAECRQSPAPHFFSGAEQEYADAILKWVAGLR